MMKFSFKKNLITSGKFQKTGGSRHLLEHSVEDTRVHRCQCFVIQIDLRITKIAFFITEKLIKNFDVYIICKLPENAPCAIDVICPQFSFNFCTGAVNLKVPVWIVQGCKFSRYIYRDKRTVVCGEVQSS